MKFTYAHADGNHTDYEATAFSAGGVVIDLRLTAYATGGGYMTMSVGSVSAVGEPSSEIQLSNQQVDTILQESGIVPGPVYEAGDKVFLRTERRLATVLDVYGDGRQGNGGDIRLDVSGNTPVDAIDKYDAALHAEYDHTFTPIKAEWVSTYGITKHVEIRAEG